MKKMNSKWILGIIALIFLTTMLLYLQGIIGGGKIKEEAASKITSPRNLQTFEVASNLIGGNIKYVGNICSRTKATISSKIVARIEKIFVQSGDFVKKGDKLVKLEDKDVNAKLKQAQAALDSAKTNLNQSKTDYERYKSLYDEKTVTKEQFDRFDSAYKMAVSSVEQAEEAKKEAQAYLGYSFIMAPFDGVIVQKQAEEGDMASPGNPIVTMYDPKDIWFESQVPESRANQIIIGQKVTVNVDALKEKLDGSVKEIVPAVDQASRTVTIRVDIPKDDRLKCGMYGSFDVPSGNVETILIPKTAVKKIGQLDSVYVVTGDSVSLRNITLGKDYGDKVEVLSGISRGDKVVINPDAINQHE
jgi:RND family efflux transporter MFP subunit